MLFDDGYLNKAGINDFPTTWFIDKDGRIAFVKVGWTQKLTEEFSWRSEALKAKEVAAAIPANVKKPHRRNEVMNHSCLSTIRITARP